MKKVFIAGCGYIGERIAHICRGSGSSVTCMVRSAEHAAILTDFGFTAIICTLDDSTAITALNVSDSIIYYLVPPPGGGIVDSRVRNFIAGISSSGKPARVIYMSATSVYAEANGGVVTEATPAGPTSAMGKRRLDAENTFREYGARVGVPVIIMRVSGIYGPGRLPLMQIRQGQPLLRVEESGPSNRIHADDLARICCAAAEKGLAGDVFNVSDGHPSSMTDYFNAVADLLGEPRQPQVPLETARSVMSPLMFSYVSESRIVDSTRMFERLGITLNYPTLTEGLRASREPAV